MQYDPKLKIIMEEIKAILKKNDIAGFVALHTNRNGGFVEYFNEISPSYSCGVIEHTHKGDGMRFRVKKAEVGEARAKELAEGTYSMVRGLSQVIGSNAMAWVDAYLRLKEAWDGKDLGGDFSSHTQQNN